jgi:acetyl esterase
MTLDNPVISAFLTEAAARSAALPPASTPAEQRAQLDGMGNELFKEVAEGIPEGVLIEDRVLPTGGDGIQVRIYRPGRGENLGVHVLVHGGGWWQGSIHDWISDVQSSERAAGVPCIVVTVEYRLAPEHPFPAGLDDCVAALRWIMEHTDELGGDPDRVSIGGVSAGANLAAAALLKLRDEGGALPGFAIFEAGVFDLDLHYDSFERFGTGFGLETAVMPVLTGMYLTDPALISNPYVSPVRAETLEGLPPAHFVTAEFDPTRDTSDAFADRLQGTGVAVTRSLRIGHIHQSPVMTKVLPIAREWREDILSALRNFHTNEVPDER